MLAGQAISLGDSLVISMTGVLIVMLELAFLALFIQVMSKLLSAIVKKNQASTNSEIPVSSSEEDDELAIIMATVLAEAGLPMEQVVFQSITRVH